MAISNPNFGETYTVKTVKTFTMGYLYLVCFIAFLRYIENIIDNIDCW